MKVEGVAEVRVLIKDRRKRPFVNVPETAGDPPTVRVPPDPVASRDATKIVNLLVDLLALDDRNLFAADFEARRADPTHEVAALLRGMAERVGCGCLLDSTMS